jgi:ribonuclease Z
VARLVVLGSAASVPDAAHDTVGLVVHGPGGAILIDCGGSPLHKLARAGIDPEEIRAVVLTHRHADHLYGLPMLIQGLWLDGRALSLPIYGPRQALDRAHELLALFGLAEREGMFLLEWHPVPLRTGRRMLEMGELVVTAAPVNHGDNETLALRFENEATKGAIVYSADTEPSQTLGTLAGGARILLHEATGDLPGHSSAAQAAEVAREAGVEQLVLIHYPVRGVDPEMWRRQATGFPGLVRLACDGDVYPF